MQKLLVAATANDPRFGLYVRVVVATGARRAEACGIKGSDVDLDAGNVAISRSYMVLPNGVRGDRPTKTRSARVITLDPDTVAALASGWDTAERAARVVGVSAADRWRGYVFSFDPDGAAA